MNDLYQDDDLRVRFRDAGGSARLIVTFAHWRSVPGVAAPGFGEAFCARYGFDAVHVTCAGNHWFQRGDMASAIAAIAAFARRYEATITYGSSMGGYQAVRAAAALGAKRCIAFSPQYSIDLDKAPWETRWAKERAEISFHEDDLRGRAGQEYILIYDPWEPLDSQHANAIGEKLNTLDLRLPFAGHATMRFLSEAGILGETVRALLGEDRGPSDLRGLVRAARGGSPTYFENLSRHTRLPAAWREGALAVATRLAPTQSPLQLRLAAVRLELNELDGAREALERAAALGADKLVVASRLAKVAMRAGQWGLAERHLREASRLGALTPSIRQQLGVTLRKLGRDAEARLVLEERAAG